MSKINLTDQETIEVRKFAVTAALGLSARGDAPQSVVEMATAIEAFIVTADPDPEA